MFKGKIEFIVLVDQFGISHVTDKCLCAMFGCHPRIVHVSKDDAYDTNNNDIKSIYQVLIIGDFGLKWKVNVERFKIVLTLKILAYVINVVSHFVEIKQGVVPNHVNFNLCSYICVILPMRMECLQTLFAHQNILCT
jgi:hypothetical protein